MSLKSVSPCVVVLVLLGLGVARGGDEPLMPVGTLDGSAPAPLPNDAPPAPLPNDGVPPAPLPNDGVPPAPLPNNGVPPAPLPSEGMTPTAMPAEAPIAAAPQPAPAALSSYILGTRPDCCGPMGGNGPIKSEIYIESGLALPVAGNIMARTLEPGWDIQGGACALFFNVDQDAAWLVNLGLSNVYNHGQE